MERRTEAQGELLAQLLQKFGAENIWQVVEDLLCTSNKDMFNHQSTGSPGGAAHEWEVFNAH